MSDVNFSKVMPTRGAAAECWDGTDEFGNPALVGFVAAQSALEWGDQSEELRRTEIIEDLVRLVIFYFSINLISYIPR